MPACGYEFYLLMINSKSHESAQRRSEISSWTLRDKIHIHVRSCNIIYIPELSYKSLWILYINNSRHLEWKYARIFVRGHYLFREAKTVSYEEQIMSKDKYPSIFSPQMKAIIFIILQIFFATCALLKIREYSRIFPRFLGYSPVLAGEYSDTWHV